MQKSDKLCFRKPLTAIYLYSLFHVVFLFLFLSSPIIFFDWRYLVRAWPNGKCLVFKQHQTFFFNIIFPHIYIILEQKKRLIYIYIYINEWIIRIRSYFCLWFSYRSVSYRTFSLSCTHQCVTKSDFIRWSLPLFSNTWPFVLHAPIYWTFFNRNSSLCLHLLINSLRLFSVAVCGWYMIQYFSAMHKLQRFVAFVQDKLNVLYETDLYENQRQKYDRILIIHSFIIALPYGIEHS